MTDFIFEVEGDKVFDQPCDTIKEAKASAIQYIEDSGYDLSSHIVIYKLVEVMSGDVSIKADWKPAGKQK